MVIHNKLVRDKIPEIIRETGKEPVVEVLSNKEYLAALNKKLQEELNEYYEDQSIDELVDLVEVIYAILKYKEVPLHKFNELRQNKVNKRGSFDEKLFLKEVLD